MVQCIVDVGTLKIWMATHSICLTPESSDAEGSGNIPRHFHLTAQHIGANQIGECKRNAKITHRLIIVLLTALLVKKSLLSINGSLAKYLVTRAHPSLHGTVWDSTRTLCYLYLYLAFISLTVPHLATRPSHRKWCVGYQSLPRTDGCEYETRYTTVSKFALLRMKVHSNWPNFKCGQ